MLKKLLLFASIVCLLLMLAGCGGSEEPTPTPTKTPNAQGGQSAASQATDTPTPVPAQPTPPPAEPAQTSSNQAATQPPTQTANQATVKATLLNIRDQPNTNGAIVATANQGEQLTVVEKSADGLWVNVGRNGQPVGWASAEFLDLPPDAPVAGQPNNASNPPAAVSVVNPVNLRSPEFGAQAFLWWRAEFAENDLRLMKDGNFDWVKQSFAWETIEGAGRGQYDWSIADRVVSQVNAVGLRLLVRLSIDPDKKDFWAGLPPASGDAFAEFAAAVAARYNCAPIDATHKGCIQAFQIWNEPNLAREWGGKRPNPAEYTAFLKKAYAAIKAVHPNAIVINAGMAPTGDDSEIAMPDDKFYDLMYQAMGGNSTGYFDMLGVHGAGYAAPPELDPAEAAANKKYGGYRFFSFRHVEDIRAIMVRYGDTNKKITLLEFGWTYDKVNPSYKWHGADAGIDEFVQAKYLKGAYQYATEHWQPWIGIMSLLTMPNPDWLKDGNAQDEEQYWWAIMEVSNVPETKWRPAFIELCIYFNGTKGQKCKYDPN